MESRTTPQVSSPSRFSRPRALASPRASPRRSRRLAPARALAYPSRPTTASRVRHSPTHTHASNIRPRTTPIRMNQSRNHRPLVVTDDGDDGSPCASGLRVCRTPRATSLGVSRASNAMRVIPSRSPRASVGSVASPCGAHVDVVVGIGDVAIHGCVCVCTPVCTSVCLSVCRAR